MPVIHQFFHRYFAIVDRYLLREFLLNLFGVISVLWLIFIATRFARYLAQAAVGNLPGDVIFTLLGFSSLGALSVLLPIGTFLAVMLALGRMNAESELTVMSACGVSDKRVMRNVLLFSGTVAILVAVLALYIVPEVLSDRYKIEQQAKLSADTSGLVAGSFKESNKGNWTFYSEGINETHGGMDNVFIRIEKEDRPLLYRAEKAHFEIDSEYGNKYLVLENGFRYEGDAGDQDFVIAEFAAHSILIEKGGEKQVKERHKALPTFTLLARGETKDLAEVQWRVSMAVMTVILGMLAMYLAKTGPRKGRYAGFLPAVIVYIIYSNLLAVTKTWVAKGTVSALFGVLWVHILVLILLVFYINRFKLKRWWQQAKANKEVAAS
jgi:lipopolysaccharide export system permease protein